MVKSNAALADFTSGWHRHDDNETIVVTSHIDIFRTAADDASCRAAILNVGKSTKDADRAAFKKIWDNLGFQRSLAFDQTSLESVYSSDAADFVKSPDELEPVDTQLIQMATLFTEMSKTSRASIWLFPNWRETQAEAKEHEPHPIDVLNRVFFSAGTLLETNTGVLQVPEGDFLYMKPFVKHCPELKSDHNHNNDRLTVVAI